MQQIKYACPLLAKTLPVYQLLKPPVYVWRLHIGGKGALCMMYEADKSPCWFHRKMQELAFGFEWEYIGP